MARRARIGLLGDAWRTGIRVDQEGTLMNPICGQKAEHARNQGTTAVDICSHDERRSTGGAYADVTWPTAGVAVEAVYSSSQACLKYARSEMRVMCM